MTATSVANGAFKSLGIIWKVLVNEIGNWGQILITDAAFKMLSVREVQTLSLSDESALLYTVGSEFSV